MDIKSTVDPVADHLMREHIATDLAAIRNIVRAQGWEDVEQLLVEAVMMILTPGTEMQREQSSVKMH